MEEVRHSWLKTVRSSTSTIPELVPHVGLNPRASMGESVTNLAYMTASEKNVKRAAQRSAKAKFVKAIETPSEREARLVVEREKERRMVAAWTPEKTARRRQQQRVAAAKRKARETSEEAAERRAKHAAEERQRKARIREAKAACQ